MLARLYHCLIAVATCGALLSVTACGAARSDPAAVARAVALLDSQVTAAATKTSQSDPMYFESGVWLNSTTTCWSCSNGGLATAAATLWRSTGMRRDDLLRQAIQTIDTAIATRQTPDGSFAPPPGTADRQSPAIATMFFGVEMGTTLIVLGPALDPARRARWADSLGRAADFMIDSGNANWYANGNLSIGNVELLYLAWRATGAGRFHSAYENAWGFVLNPPQDRFPGEGLRIVKPPLRTDGSDGMGYLTEKGAGGVGFDAEYTELQLDVASRLWLLSGDPRALRLANLIVNMLLPRVDPAWELNTSGGTRHTEANRKVPFLSSAPAVLAWRAGRADLRGLVLPHILATATQYAAPWFQGNDVFRRALGNDISVIVLAGIMDGEAPPPAAAHDQTSSSPAGAVRAAPAAGPR